MSKRKQTRGKRAHARRGTARAWIANPASQLGLVFGEPEQPKARAKILGPRGEALSGITPAAAKKEAEVIQLYGPPNFDEADAGLSRRSVAQYARHRGGSRAYGPMTKGQAEYQKRKAAAAAKKKPKKAKKKAAKKAKPRKRTKAEYKAAAKKAAATRARNAAAKAAAKAARKTPKKKAKPMAKKAKKSTAAKRSASAKKAARTRKANAKAAVKSTALAVSPRVHHAQLVVAKARPYAKNKARKPFGKKKGWLALPVAGTIYSPIRGVAMRNPSIPGVLKDSAKLVASAAIGSVAAYALGQASQRVSSTGAQFAVLAAAATAAVGVTAMVGLPAAGITIGVLSGGQLVGIAQNLMAQRKMSGLLGGLVQRPQLGGLVQRPAINGLVNSQIGAMPSERNREIARRQEPELSRVGAIFGRQNVLRRAGY